MSALLRKLSSRVIGGDREEDELVGSLWGPATSLGDDARSVRSLDFDDTRSIDGRCGLDKDQERQYKQLYDAFLVMEASLQKYWKTCTAFLEVSSLVQEGVDQMTADVLSFCSSMEEDAMIQSLENDALCMRDGMACEEVVNESVRKHLLGPMGDRLAFFQAVKVRAREMSAHRHAYRNQRKTLGSMRVARNCNPVKLKAAEHELGVLANKFESTFRALVSDLQDLHDNRARILREPFDALRRCQAEFMRHLSDVLVPAAPPPAHSIGAIRGPPHSNQHAPMEQHARENVWMPPAAQCAAGAGNLKTDWHTDAGTWDHQVVADGYESAQQISRYTQARQQQLLYAQSHMQAAAPASSTSPSSPAAAAAAAETAAASVADSATTSTALQSHGPRPRQRHQVAQIVKDYHLMRGRRIFERPARFEALEVAPPGRPGPLARVQGEAADLDAETSTYLRVRRFAASVRRSAQGVVAEQGRAPKVLGEADAASRLQAFARTLAAQKQARELADQIIAAHRDNAGYTFYSNPHTGYMSWTRPLFVRMGDHQ